MRVIIKNNFLEIEIESKGAELKSIKTSDKHEYLWQGDTKSWAKSSPILFPIVGAINNDRYVYNEKSYPLTQHGFGRDLEYSIVEQEEDSVLFSASSNEETSKIYPFTFEIFLGYKLKENSVEVSYKVVNKDDNKMLFSIGAHPGFNCPINPDLKYDDYRLSFNKNENSARRIKEGSLLTGKREESLNGNSISLSYELMEKAPLIFDDLKSTKITLESDLDRRKVIMDFEGFPYFGIWASSPADFVCLEPWYGIDSTAGDLPNLEKKEGLIPLEGKESFKAAYSIEVR